MLSAPSVLPARACVARGGGNWPQRGLGALFPGAGLGEASQNGLLWVLEDGSAVVRVQNVYRTWERFYATVLDADDGARIEISPSCGDLAPRGGANNVCDPDKPYRDWAELRIRATGLVRGEASLLVRTEEEQWLFTLRVA